MKTDIDEYFGCQCTDLNHILHLTYWENEGYEDNEMYIITPVNQWRTNIVPYFWDYLFDKYFWQEDIKTKDFWTKNLWQNIYNFYYGSIYKKFVIFIKYLFNKENKSIFDSTSIKIEDLYRFKYSLKMFATDSKDTNEDCKLHTLENSYYRFNIEIEDEGEDFPQSICTSFRFKPKKGFKKFIYALKYLLNIRPTEGDFEVTKEDASELIKIVETVQRENKKRENKK